MNRISKVTRRDFLVTTAGLASTGLILQVRMPALLAASSKEAVFQPNVYLSITSDNRIIIICHRSEMGQSVRRSMPMLIAEELEVDINQIEVVQAVGDKEYGDQNTDGSTSARKNYDPLRQAGAAAREMLIVAAAKKWNVSPKNCSAVNGVVVNAKSKLTYGELAEAAAKLPVPSNPPLKKPAEFKVIGKPLPGLDVEDMSSGRAHYGIDVDFPELLYASIERCPHRDGMVKTYDGREALKIAGVQRVVTLDAIGPDTNTNAGVAVIANNTWSALQGRRALKIKWSDAPAQSDYKQVLTQALAGEMKAMVQAGNVVEGLKNAEKTLSSEYYVPFLAHAPMEPPNATAWVKNGKCEVWAPTQDPQRARRNVAKFLGLDVDKVTINVTLLGGGFGRKSQPDFILEAVGLAQKMKKPVKVTWTREDDIQHGFYHAASLQKITAGVNADGQIAAWHHKSAYPSNMTVFVPDTKGAVDWEIGMGASNHPYRIPNQLIESGAVGSPIRIGWMRSVANIQHAFAVNCFMDEIAESLQIDPVEYRLKLMGTPHTPATEGDSEFKQDTGRLATVMKRVAEMGRWNAKRPKGTGIGFANHYSFYSYVAMTVEAKMENDNVVVNEVNCVVDCGIALNTDTVRAQIEGGIIFGLSLALHGNITESQGAVQQSNFHDYPVLRMTNAPKINIEIIQNESKPTGVGEPGVPPVAPALCSALFKVTGKRIRELPILKS